MIPTVPGRWYVNKHGESHARLIVGLEWSSWGKPLIRIRQVWTGRSSSEGVVLAESLIKPSQWKFWSGQIQEPGWEPSWLSTARMGPSVKL